MTGFIITKEHRRFVEFAQAVKKQRTIGICVGPAGVGKTLSARRYTRWDTLHPFIRDWGPRNDSDAQVYALAARTRTAFYTPAVLASPKATQEELTHEINRLGICIGQHLTRDDPGPDHHSQYQYADLVDMVIIDEAERLSAITLEVLRDQHDRTQRAVILIGMPGLDKRFSRYPQLYSRLGFAHQYRALTNEELLFVLTRHWKRLGHELDLDDFTDAQAIAAVQRITRGNFRLLERLLPPDPTRAENQRPGHHHQRRRRSRRQHPRHRRLTLRRGRKKPWWTRPVSLGGQHSSRRDGPPGRA